MHFSTLFSAFSATSSFFTVLFTRLNKLFLLVKLTQLEVNLARADRFSAVKLVANCYPNFYQNPRKHKNFHQRQQQSNRQNCQAGITLIEVLIVVVIMGILTMAAFFTYQKQLSKARDAQRKDDVEKIKVAFEDYYNDNGCYPPTNTLEFCGQEWNPYLKEIPCDPLTGEPYLYYSLGGNACLGYKVLVSLENTQDPGIAEIGCNYTDGCEAGNPAYNYGAAAGNTMLSSSWELGGEGGGESEDGAYQSWVCLTIDYGGYIEADCKSLIHSFVMSLGCDPDLHTYAYSGDCDQACTVDNGCPVDDSQLN